jgi:hypothetical protein
VLNREGHEVPFFVDVARARSGAAPQAVRVAIVDVFREEQHREDAPPLRRESFVLETPKDFDPSYRWSLGLSPGTLQDFVRRVEVTQRRAGDETVRLVRGVRCFAWRGPSKRAPAWSSRAPSGTVRGDARR